MRIYKTLDPTNFLERACINFLEIEDLEVKIIEPVPAKFLSSSVLLFGDVDLEFLKAILKRFRSLIYIGNNIDVINIINEFAEENDWLGFINKPGITLDIYIYRNGIKSIQIYSSYIYTILELTVKYLTSSGVKINILAKYISQFLEGRTSLSLDFKEVDKLKDLYDSFIDYDTEVFENGKKYDKERLIEILNKNNPS